MTIVLCGGGSGGHITPLLAVASELRARDKSVQLVYVGERGGKFASIAESSKLFDELHYISAGKLRRYHGESILIKLLDVKTNVLNIRDSFRIIAGCIQAYGLLRKIKPNALFLKGGFVCVPVALAAHQLHQPFVTHDSDALPGLSNRIAARWASYHAVAMPAKYYPYPAETVREVGVPSDNRFRDYSVSEKAILKAKYNIAPDARILLITGGSNGARRLNEAVIAVLPQLLERYPKLHVLHQIGANNQDQISAFTGDASRVDFFEFSPELFHMSAVADVVVTRAGASIMADLGNQKKACVVVPNPYLTGGHQLKNAQVYKDAHAALIVSEQAMLSNNDSNLYNTITSIIDSKKLQIDLGSALHDLQPSTPAAASIAGLVCEVASK